jgi:type VI secretion system protein ImpF
VSELNPRDRLQPFLLDRLTDDQSDQQKESREKNVFSPRQIRNSLMRDLAWLLNTQAPIEADGLAEFPQVMTSVLNYGIPDLTGRTASGIAGSDVERNLLRAIQNFEPRLDRQSINVEVVSDESRRQGNGISLEIRGEMVANPMPEALYIKTEVDLETGQFVVKDRPNG